MDAADDPTPDEPDDAAPLAADEPDDGESAAADEAEAAELLDGAAAAAATGTAGTLEIGQLKEGIMKFDVITGLVEIEYGVRIVGDCIIENGDATLGVTLIVGIILTGAGFAPDAAAAAADRFLRPAADAAAALELPNGPRPE